MAHRRAERARPRRQFRRAGRARPRRHRPHPRSIRRRGAARHRRRLRHRRAALRAWLSAQRIPVAGRQPAQRRLWRQPRQPHAACRSRWSPTCARSGRRIDPMFVRVSAIDGIDGGWTIDDTIAFARELKALGRRRGRLLVRRICRRSPRHPASLSGAARARRAPRRRHPNNCRRPDLRSRSCRSHRRYRRGRPRRARPRGAQRPELAAARDEEAGRQRRSLRRLAEAGRLRHSRPRQGFGVRWKGSRSAVAEKGRLLQAAFSGSGGCPNWRTLSSAALFGDDDAGVGRSEQPGPARRSRPRRWDAGGRNHAKPACRAA